MDGDRPLGRFTFGVPLGRGKSNPNDVKGIEQRRECGTASGGTPRDVYR